MRRALHVLRDGGDLAGSVELGDSIYGEKGWERVTVVQRADIGGVNAISFNGYARVGIGERIFCRRRSPDNEREAANR
jgi:hypothetical protein